MGPDLRVRQSNTMMPVPLRFGLILCGVLFAALQIVAAQEPAGRDLFFELYGDEYKQVRLTPDKADDLALIDRMLNTAESEASVPPELLAFMCQTIMETAARIDDGGHARVLRAVNIWAKKDPAHAPQAREAMADYYQALYMKTRRAGRTYHQMAYARALMIAADAYEKAGDIDQAVQVLERVKRLRLSVSEQVEPWLDRLQAIQRAKTIREQYLQRLARTPDDVQLRSQMYYLLLTELDAPADAMKYIDPMNEQMLKLTPLLTRRLSDLSTEQLLALGNWYHQTLLEKADSEAAKFRLLQQSRQYYKTAADQIDVGVNKLKITTAIDAIDKAMAVLPDSRSLITEKSDYYSPIDATIPNEAIRLARQRVRLPVEQQVQSIRDQLRQDNQGAEIPMHDPRINGRQIERLHFAWDNPNMTNIDALYGLEVERLGLSNSPGLKSIAALQGMRRLNDLDLNYNRNLQSLAGIERLPLERLRLGDCRSLQCFEELASLNKLKHLDLWSTQFDNLNVLTRLKLESLNLSNCQQLTDLSPLKKMRTLKRLYINNCRNIRNIEVLKELKLEVVEVAGVPGFDSVDLVAHMPLQELNVSNTNITTLAPLAGKKIRRLAINGCEKLEDLRPVSTMAVTDLSVGRLDHLLGKDLTLLRDLGLKLNELNVSGSESLESLQGIEQLPLRSLSVARCKNLKSLAGVDHLSQLHYLACHGSPQLGDQDWRRLINLRARFGRLNRVSTGDRLRDRAICPPPQ